MYKIAIIDDEPIIVEGLARSLDWEKWDTKVAGLAYNGKEGIEMIRQERPDMVITDISMPQMDGLVMIAALRSEFPGMQITILTGYRNFDYAQEAIRLGVNRFLLKPSKMNELEEAITYMISNLSKLKEPFLISEGDERAEAVEAEGGMLEESKDETDAAEHSKQLAKESFEEHAASSFIVKNAVAYIQENYAKKLRLVDVADQIFVSQWHLSKLLNKYTGQSFSDILNGIRVEKAKELLKNPSLRISDVAEAVGFLDLTHFSRVFKKVEGMSANEYRNHL